MSKRLYFVVAIGKLVFLISAKIKHNDVLLFIMIRFFIKLVLFSLNQFFPVSGGTVLITVYGETGQWMLSRKCDLDYSLSSKRNGASSKEW